LLNVRTNSGQQKIDENNRDLPLTPDLDKHNGIAKVESNVKISILQDAYIHSQTISET